MKKYTISVVYESWQRVEVEAENLEDAKDSACELIYALDDNASIMDIEVEEVEEIEEDWCFIDYYDEDEEQE